jgi:hypothetical protein
MKMKKPILAALFFLGYVYPAFACDAVLAKYGEQKTLDFCLFVTDATVGAVKVENAVHALGDTYIMQDEATEANTTNGFVDEGSCYSITLTAAEMSYGRVLLNIEDQGTKAWADKCILLETYEDVSPASMVSEASVTVYNASVGAVTNQTSTAIRLSGTTFAAGRATLNGDYVSGTGTTLSVTLQHSPDNTNWFDVGTFASVGTTDAMKEFVIAAPLFRYLRTKITTTGTTPVYNVTVEIWGTSR